MRLYTGLPWRKRKNKYDDREIRALTARPNIVRATVRTMAAGMSFFLVYNTAFSIYNHREQRKFIKEGNEVVYRAEALVDSLKRERSYLLPSDEGSLLDKVVTELQALRRELTGGSCRAPPVLEHGRYVADVRECMLHVKIPYGGSLSEASELYFSDTGRWRSDLGYNKHIRNPDRVAAGTSYRFSLR